MENVGWGSVSETRSHRVGDTPRRRSFVRELQHRISTSPQGFRYQSSGAREVKETNTFFASFVLFPHVPRTHIVLVPLTHALLQVLMSTARLMAPVTPFFSEYIYQVRLYLFIFFQREPSSTRTRE